MLVRTILALVLLGAPAWAQPAPMGDAERGWFIASGGNERAGPCFPCHGTQGQGDDTQAAPRLAGLSPWYLYKQMKNFTDGTRPNAIMTPIAEDMAVQEWWDIGAFYSALDTPLPPPPALSADTMERGRTLAHDGLPDLPACAACHGEDGEGAPLAVPPLAGQGATYMAEQLRHWQTGQRRNDPATAMRHIARALSPEDIRAVSEYYEAMR